MMPDVSLLRRSAETATLVGITVTACKYRCCGGGWQRRGEGVYRGRVLSMDESGILLELPNELGQAAEAVVRFEDIVEIVD
jgi:hypothetical protein